jgi:hypothetical protein
VLLTLSTGLVALVLPAVLALVGVDFLDTRNVLVALPLLIVVASVGFATVAAPRSVPLLASGALAALSVVILILVDTHPQYQRTDWRGAADALGRATVTRALAAPGDAQLPLSIYTHRLEAMTAPVAVREIDVVALPASDPGGRQGTAPRPPAHFPVPAGFSLRSATYGSEFTVLRYSSARPDSLTPHQIAGLSLTPGDAASLIQRPGG